MLVSEKNTPNVAKTLPHVFKFAFLPRINEKTPTINAAGVSTKLKWKRAVIPKINENIAKFCGFKEFLVSLKLCPLSKSGFKTKGETFEVSMDLPLSKVKRNPKVIADIKLKIIAKTIENSLSL
jgi:hypothetical protein